LVCFSLSINKQAYSNNKMETDEHEIKIKGGKKKCQQQRRKGTGSNSKKK